MKPFDFDAAGYTSASKHQKAWGNRLIAELELAGDESVLDLGCGDGVLTAELAGRVPRGRVVGVDSSPGMVQAARRIAGPNMVVRLMDINNLDCDGEFDVVFSNATLHWVKDHESLLRNTLRALRPGGTLRFNFAGAGNCPSFCRVVREVMSLPAFAARFAGFEWPWYMPTAEEYGTLVGRCAFKTARVWLQNADTRFADAGEMTRWIDHPSLVPFLQSLGETDKKSFRDEVVDRMIRATMQEDETCFETFRRINVLARKP